LVFSKQVEISTEWQWISFDWAGISKFTWDPVSPETTSNVTIDNFTYDESVSEEHVPVPTMTTYGVALAIMALLLTAGYRLRTSAKRK